MIYIPKKFKSLNAHATQILSIDTPVRRVSNPSGREVLVFAPPNGETIEKYLVWELPATDLPVPQVGATLPTLEEWEIEEGKITVQVSSGSLIANLPPYEKGVVWMTSYPTAKAASEIGRKDFVNAGPSVFADYDAATGRGTTILGCLGVNRFA